MKLNETVDIGIIGAGNMGSGYIDRFRDGEIERTDPQTTPQMGQRVAYATWHATH